MMGAPDAITGALIDWVRRSPRKKKMILMVIPERALPSSSHISVDECMRRFAFFRKITSMMRAPIANRQKARVNGGILVRLTLNMGDAAPQMVLAIIRAAMACWAGDKFIK